MVNKKFKKGQTIWYMDHVQNDVRSAMIIEVESIDKATVLKVTATRAGVSMKKPPILISTRHVLGEWAFETEFEAKECLKKHIRKVIEIKRQQVLDLMKKLRSL